MTKQQPTNITNEILNGNLIKLMLKLSIPGIVGMFLIGLTSFVDALCAGQLIGETALAAITLALPLTSITIGFAMSVGVGCASVLSRAIGSGDAKTQSKIFGNLIILNLIISCFITIIGYSFAEELISFMGGKGEVAFYGAEYFKIYMLGSIFLSLAVSLSQLIKAEGKIPLATLFAGIYVLINIILNIVFVTQFNWQLPGIALATVIAALIYSIINSTYFLYGKSSIFVNPKKLTLALDILPDILSVGASVLLIQVMGIVQQILLFKSIAHYGTVRDVAFAGATIRLYSLLLNPSYGFVQALNPVIGMNFGAKKYKRLKNTYLTFGIGSTIFLILIWLPIQLYPIFFLRWLIPNFIFTDNDLLNFHIVTFLLPTSSFFACSLALFQAIGNGKRAGLVTLLREVVLFLPILLTLPIFFGVNGIYYGITTVQILSFLIVALFTWIEFRKIHFQMVIKKLGFEE